MSVRGRGLAARSWNKPGKVSPPPAKPSFTNVALPVHGSHPFQSAIGSKPTPIRALSVRRTDTEDAIGLDLQAVVSVE